ncbi:MAG: tail fiber domain-containing protein [Acidocella sp.]|nr:tail fiber domain-containing protein [Acidocella sp.]
MSEFDHKSADTTSASHQGETRSEVKRRALFGMITKTAFVAPVVASFALDSLSLDKASAVMMNSNSSSLNASDIRLKKNIQRIGTHPLGIGLYEFSYIGSSARHTGVMAQEVLTVAPHAVVTGPGGFYRVDYGALGL